jgi:hypothetical protein
METNTLRTGVAAVGVALAYGISCWRIFRRFRGDKFIECASITTFLLMGVIAVHRIPNVPSWVVKAILPLMVFSAGYRFISACSRRTMRFGIVKPMASPAVNSEAGGSTRGLGQGRYKHQN